jgi:hypothetical protein
MMNAQLPKQIDRVTTLELIAYGNRELKYEFKVDLPPGKTMHWEKIWPNVVKVSCDKWGVELKDGNLVRVVYEYSVGGHVAQTMPVTKSDCP